MQNNIGVLNSNSQMKSYGKGVSMPGFPLTTENEIHNLSRLIAAIDNMREYKFATGQLAEARLHAIRIGNIRSELRQLKAGM